MMWVESEACCRGLWLTLRVLCVRPGACFIVPAEGHATLKTLKELVRKQQG